MMMANRNLVLLTSSILHHTIILCKTKLKILNYLYRTFEMRVEMAILAMRERRRFN